MHPWFPEALDCADRNHPIRSIMVAAFGLAAAVSASPASASPNAPPGSIIVSRDVPFRRATQPGAPGDVNAVQTAPAQDIFDSVNQVAVPITDDQFAQISSGPLTQAADGITGAIDAATSVLSGAGQREVSNSAQLNATGLSGGAGMGPGFGAIQSGLSTLGTALGSIKGAITP